jgi:hypothetical protein
VRKRETFHNADEGSGFSGGAGHSDRRLLVLGLTDCLEGSGSIWDDSAKCR